MNLNDLHRRLLQDVLEIGNAFPLVITGGYAVQAHRIVDRFSRDIDMATDSMATMEVIVATVVDGLIGRGWRVEVIGIDPHGARMMTTDPGSGEQCELDVLRESFSSPPEITPYGPVLALDDVIGTKVRALAGRGLPRDLIDIHAASRLRTTAELEALGRRHAWEDESTNSAWMSFQRMVMVCSSPSSRRLARDPWSVTMLPSSAASGALRPTGPDAAWSVTRGAALSSS